MGVGGLSISGKEVGEEGGVEGELREEEEKEEDSVFRLFAGRGFTLLSPLPLFLPLFSFPSFPSKIALDLLPTPL